ncbi:hypothetical protein GCM10023144_43290 [Pigmentiphaga soli]|uniref:Uncharacterized protein n=1 Tax=Pigmentiphaga soli TaxID=1007095 RepID=A0ABP8HNR0_9BURK
MLVDPHHAGAGAGGEQHLGQVRRERHHALHRAVQLHQAAFVVEHPDRVGPGSGRRRYRHRQERRSQPPAAGVHG